MWTEQELEVLAGKLAELQKENEDEMREVRESRQKDKQAVLAACEKDPGLAKGLRRYILANV